MVRPGPQVYVQTRGTARAADYAFLCGAPPHPWWREYRDATAFDHPTVLVVSTGGSWAAYLSGIPSARVDAVGTTVRYTLVLDGPCGDGPVAALLPTAVAAWLDDVADAPAGGRLTAALDAGLPPEDVQRWIGAPPPAAPAADLAVLSEPGRRVLEAVATLPRPRPGGAGPSGDWVGGVGSAPARAAFVERVARLVDGTRGRALLLNLTGTDEAAALAAPDSPVAVLVEGTAPPEPLSVQGRGPVEAKKVPAAAPRSWAAGAVAVTTTVVVAVLAVLLTLVVLLL